MGNPFFRLCSAPFADGIRFYYTLIPFLVNCPHARICRTILEICVRSFDFPLFPSAAQRRAVLPYLQPPRQFRRHIRPDPVDLGTLPARFCTHRHNFQKLCLFLHICEARFHLFSLRFRLTGRIRRDKMGDSARRPIRSGNAGSSISCMF